MSDHNHFSRWQTLVQTKKAGQPGRVHLCLKTPPAYCLPRVHSFLTCWRPHLATKDMDQEWKVVSPGDVQKKNF